MISVDFNWFLLLVLKEFYRFFYYFFLILSLFNCFIDFCSRALLTPSAWGRELLKIRNAILGRKVQDYIFKWSFWHTFAYSWQHHLFAGQIQFAPSYHDINTTISISQLQFQKINITSISRNQYHNINITISISKCRLFHNQQEHGRAFETWGTVTDHLL